MNPILYGCRYAAIIAAWAVFAIVTAILLSVVIGADLGLFVGW